MKKIVFYSERWVDGGIEALIMNIISNSNLSEFEYKIIVGQKETNSFDSKINEYGIEFIEMHNKHFKNPIFRTLSSFFKFKKIISRESDAIIHINIYNSVGLVLGSLVKNKEKNRVIIHAHNNGIDKENDKLYIKRISNCIFRKIFTNTHYNYIACSDLAAKFCFDTKKIEKYYIMKNGIASDKFCFNEETREKIRSELNIDNDTLVLGHVGRFVYQKNHVFLIDVFNKFIKTHNNSKLLLIGSGPLMKELEKKVCEYNLKDKVIFLGNTENVEKYMCAMDLFVFPSLYEGLGIVLIEAQCSGLRCFATDGLPDLVKVTNNIFFLELDINVWEKSLIEQMSYKRMNMSDEIRKAGFDIYDSVKNLEKEYEAIFNEK